MILYISKAFEDNIGATMHYNALKEIYGSDSVYTIDLRLIEPAKRKNYIAYGKFKNSAERIKRMLQGNMDYISNYMIHDICKIIKENNIQVVFIEDSVFGNLVKKIKKYNENVQVVSFYHDIKSVLYKEWIKKEKWIYKTNLMLGILQERVNQKYTDCNLVFNQRDAELFERTYGSSPEGILALPCEIPTMSDGYQTAVTPQTQRKTALFVGKNYYPNIVGIRWFYDNILPKLNDNIIVQIVGRDTEFLREEFQDSRMQVVGGVDSLAPYYENADIVIAPLFDGGGMKSKTVEALSYGKLFVGTEESLFGFWEEMQDEIKNKLVYQCNTEDDWGNILNKLCEEETLKFREPVYKLFLEKFSYDVAKERLREILEA